MCSLLFLLVLLISLSPSLAGHSAYNGHGLYEITVRNVEEMKIVTIIENRYKVDTWANAIPGKPGYSLVRKDNKYSFENELRTYNIRFKLESNNVNELIDEEHRMMSKVTRRPYNLSNSQPLPLDLVYTYEEVDKYIEDVAAAYPRTVTLVNAGKSFEGRPIKYLKISSTKFLDPAKPIVFIESLLHCREWITQAVTLYAIQKLVIDVTEPDLLHSIDWIILPVANPDGFVHTHREGRFWRKNRATGYLLHDLCIGVDLNRNFDVNWAQASSNMVCSDTFHGRSPFSEPESRIIRNIFKEHSSRMALFLDFHSFGSMILFGYGNGVLPPNGNWVHEVGIRMAQAIDKVKESWNPKYIVGNVLLVLYAASGSSMDYASTVGVPYTYTFELPGRRYGVGFSGFLVDPAFIEQAGYETWEGIKMGARYIKHMYNIRES